MILVVDNYDSFTYNLVQYFGEMGAEPVVRRNDEITIAGIEAMQPERICISPGPCTPKEAGISNEVIRQLAGRFPILGVCLGHQCIGEVYGGDVVRAGRLMHGKTSPILHNGKDLFRGIPNPFEATRYHSLIVRRETFPDVLEMTAETAEGEIMGLRHRELPLWGVQFHPESILTIHGKELLRNFLSLQREAFNYLSITGTLTGFNPNRIALNSANFTVDPGLSGGTWSIQTNSFGNLTQIDLIYAVPEPSTDALLGLGATALAIVFRRRQFKSYLNSCSRYS